MAAAERSARLGGRWRRVVAAAGLAAIVGACARGVSIVVAPAPAIDALDTEAIDASVFLVGDAGHAKPGDRVLGEVARQGSRAPRSSAIVFLGDNVYPNGVPPDTAKGYPEARRRLYAQAEVAKTAGLRTIFVAGNHDWDRQGAAGWVSVQRQDLLLRRYADSTGANVELIPRAGCPGPVTVEIGERVRLVAVDTPWWFQREARPGREPSGLRSTMPDPLTRCPIDTEPAVLDALRRIHEAPSDRVGIMVGHHPLESNGEHGGYHPWVQYLFPFVPTPFARWLWLPIGWIYPLGRKAIGHPQDVASRRYRDFRTALQGTFSARSPLIYAAGHEHSLEVIRRGAGRFYLVSGAGTEDHQTAIGRGDSTAYSSPRPGFIRVDVLRDGRVRVGVTTLSREGHVRETFQGWIKER